MGMPFMVLFLSCGEPYGRCYEVSGSFHWEYPRARLRRWCVGLGLEFMMRVGVLDICYHGWGNEKGGMDGVTGF